MIKKISYLLLAPTALFLLLVVHPVFAQDVSFQDSLTIVDSKIHYSANKNEAHLISCIGTVENHSNKSWNELVFEVQYFNSEDQLIDTTSEYDYSIVIPAHDTIAFRVTGHAIHEASEYQTHKVRITSATPESCNDPAPSKSKRKRINIFIDILISWTPMLILIAVWIFFMRKYQGKKSPQRKILELQEKQCKLVEQQNALFEKLIEVIENKAQDQQNN